MPLLKITDCTKYIKNYHKDSVYKYIITSNNLCDTINVKIFVLTNDVEKFINHLELDYSQYKKERTEWFDMLDKSYGIVEDISWSELSTGPVKRNEKVEGEQVYRIDIDKDEYLRQLVNNKLNRLFNIKD